MINPLSILCSPYNSLFKLFELKYLDRFRSYIQDRLKYSLKKSRTNQRVESFNPNYFVYLQTNITLQVLHRNETLHNIS